MTCQQALRDGKPCKVGLSNLRVLVRARVCVPRSLSWAAPEHYERCQVYEVLKPVLLEKAKAEERLKVRRPAQRSQVVSACALG